MRSYEPQTVPLANLPRGMMRPIRQQRHRRCRDGRKESDPPTGKVVPIYWGATKSLLRYMKTSKYDPLTENKKHEEKK